MMRAWIGVLVFTSATAAAFAASAQFYPGGMGSAFIGAPPVSRPEPLPLSTVTTGPRKSRAAKKVRTPSSSAGLRTQRNR
jgi:hypothetical protein